MIYYVSKAITSQAKKGTKWQFEILPVHFVGILNFILDKEEMADEVVQHIQLKNQDNKVITNIVSYTLIQLPLFDVALAQLETDRERWLYVFRQMEQLRNVPDKLKTSIFEDIFEINEHFAMNPRTRQLWEEGIKRQRDFHNQLLFAKMEGKNEGKLEGKLEGQLEGKLEALRTIAKNLKARGDSFQMIALITGLNEAEIAKL
jgi:predicted transposase/invertase (TIGR01784 family)